MKNDLHILHLFINICILFLIGSYSLVAQTTWTGASSTDWNTASNWNQGIPTNTTDVLIPANCTRYPVLTSASACRYIYIASGACLGNQHLLSYEKAFVDVSIPTNRYVRITPPLKETYSGDLFTQEQGGQWSELTPASYQPTEGTTGPNRAYPGATYQSLYANNITQRDAYGNTVTESMVSGWSEPFNALKTKYQPLQALDVWVDPGHSQDKGSATFHFPSKETHYKYYDVNGKEQSFGEDVERTAESGRFVYDATYSNGILDVEFSRVDGAENPAVTIGNPAMAYLNIKEFLKQNGTGNLSPYLYRHNEAFMGRGEEIILYYNKSADALYQVSNTEATTGTSISETDARNYIAPARAFRVVATPTEPRLIGRYSCTYTYPEMKLYRRKRKYNAKRVKWEWTYENTSVSSSKESHTLTIKPNETSPDQVVLVNFAGKGTSINATVKPTDENHGTITIANGTYISYANNDWENGNKNLYIYGANAKTPTLAPSSLGESNYTQGAQYVHTDNPGNLNIGFVYFDYYTQYATSLDYDIVIDYTIANDGTLSLSLRNGFAIYNQELKNGTKTNLVKKSVFDNQNSVVFDNNDNKNNTSRGNLVAWWVYSDMTASKGTTEEKDVFIMPEALGNYTTNIRNEYSTFGNLVSPGTYHITIRRYRNSYDQVAINGLYPGYDSYVIGTISKSGDKYTLTIPDGQLVKKVSDTDNSKNFYLYGCTGTTTELFGELIDNRKRTNKDITLQWNGSVWKTTENNQFAQVSLNGKQPSNDNPGFFWYRYEDDTKNTLYFEQKDIFTEEVGTPPPSQETTVEQVALRFAPSMFTANPTITSGKSLAPRQASEEEVASPVVSIRATSGEMSGSTLLVKDSNASNAFSMSEDAPLFDVNDYAFCLATLAGEQVVGVNVVNEIEIVPLYLHGAVQTATLHFENIEALGGEVELYDALTEDSVLITPGQCSIDIELYDGDEAGRFFLRRRMSVTPEEPQGPATEVPVVRTEQALQAWSPMKGVAVVYAGEQSSEARLQIINMSGQIVYNAHPRTLHTVKELFPGVYVVRVGTPTDHQETKLIVH